MSMKLASFTESGREFTSPSSTDRSVRICTPRCYNVDERAHQQTSPVELLPVVPDKVDLPCPAYNDSDSTREFIHHFTSWLLQEHSCWYTEVSTQQAAIYSEHGSESDFLLQLIWSYHTTFERLDILVAGYSPHWFQAMFNGVQSAAWSCPRLHLGLLC